MRSEKNDKSENFDMRMNLILMIYARINILCNKTNLVTHAPAYPS